MTGKRKDSYAQVGVIAAIVIGTASMSLSDFLRLLLGSWLEWACADEAARIVLGIGVLLAILAGVAIFLWGERIKDKQFVNPGLVLGTVIGIPMAAVAGLLLSLVQKTNRSQMWMDEALMFRVCRLVCASVIPLCAFIGYLVFAIKLRKKPSP